MTSNKFSVADQLVLAGQAKQHLTHITRPILRVLEDGNWVLCWTEASPRETGVQLRRFDSSFKPISGTTVTTTGDPFTTISVQPTKDGFAITWTSFQAIFAIWFDAEGRKTETTSLGNAMTKVADLRTAKYAHDRLAVSWQSGLIVKKPISAPLLAKASLETWHSALIALEDSVLRLETGAQRPYSESPPIYSINFSEYCSQAREVRTFEYEVPTTIIDDSYGHPEHLVGTMLGDRLLICWTNAGYTLGNAIMAMLFDSEGAPIDEPKVLVQANRSEHVAKPSLAILSDGTVLIGWSKDDRGSNRFYVQSISASLHIISEVEVIADQIPNVASEIVEDGSGGACAVWTDGHRVFVKKIESQPQPNWMRHFSFLGKITRYWAS